MNPRYPTYFCYEKKSSNLSLSAEFANYLDM